MSKQGMRYQLGIALTALGQAEREAASTTGAVVPGEEIQQEILALYDRVERLRREQTQ